MLANHDIIVIGGSAGSIEPLTGIFSALPPRLKAAVFVVIHTPAENTGALPGILTRTGNFPVEHARDGEVFRQGRAYVALPDHHLMINDGKIAVTHGPRENGFRPAIDPLFYTAARSHPGRVIGVLLSGALDDGTYGLAIIKEHQGIAVVQRPADAAITSMPLSAIKNVEVDHIVRTKDLPSLLIQIVDQPGNGKEKSHMAKQEPAVRGPNLHSWGSNVPPLNGPPSVFTCPECGGTLWELDEGKVLRFRCHTGHSFSVQSLLLQQDGKLENALWNAARVMQEKAVLRRHLAHRIGKQGMNLVAANYLQQAEEAEENAAAIRGLLDQVGSTPIPPKQRKSEKRSSKKKRRKRR